MRSEDEKKVHTHGSDTDQRCTDTGVETSAQTIAGNTLLDDVHGRGVGAALSSLQADLDKVKRVADNDSADASDGAGARVAQLVEEAGAGLCLDLLGAGQLLLDLLDECLCGGGSGT